MLLVTDTRQDPDGMLAKVADFGLSRALALGQVGKNALLAGSNSVRLWAVPAISRCQRLAVTTVGGSLSDSLSASFVPLKRRGGKRPETLLWFLVNSTDLEEGQMISRH
jgi:hypothetical protein